MVSSNRLESVIYDIDRGYAFGTALTRYVFKTESAFFPQIEIVVTIPAGATPLPKHIRLRCLHFAFIHHYVLSGIVNAHN